MAGAQPYPDVGISGNLNPDPTADPNFVADTGNIVWRTNGVLFPNGAIGTQDIPDGTSNTLMIGESWMGLWGDGTSCCDRFRNDLPGLAMAGGEPVPTDFDATWPISANVIDPQNCSQVPPTTFTIFGFGSLHEEVANFTLADGSVRSVNKSIDRTLLRLLAMRADGSPIPSEY